jgi:hypothetical protein
MGYNTGGIARAFINRSCHFALRLFWATSHFQCTGIAIWLTSAVADCFIFVPARTRCFISTSILLEFFSAWTDIKIILGIKGEVGPFKRSILATRFINDGNMRCDPAFLDQPTRAEAADILRSLIDRITITPDLKTGAPELSLEGNLAGILSLSQTAKNAAGISPDDVQQVKLVAGVGFEPTTFRL